MDSCKIETSHSHWQLGPQCPLDKNVSQQFNWDICSASWQNDYIYALQNSETRVYNKAKDLLYGYSLIWIVMCMPKLYMLIHAISPKQILAALSKLSKLRRRSTVAKPQSNPDSAAGAPPVKQYLDSGCPVCLASSAEMCDLTPVHGECGHALCAECFVGMWNHGKALLYPLSCPLCTATLNKITPVTTWPAGKVADARMVQVDRTICRYNLVFSGTCVGIFSTSGMTVYRVIMDAVGRTLRLGYFFVLFDRKMKKTISFFFLHFVIAIAVEYFENAYLLNLLEHL